MEAENLKLRYENCQTPKILGRGKRVPSSFVGVAGVEELLFIQQTEFIKRYMT